MKKCSHLPFILVAVGLFLTCANSHQNPFTSDKAEIHLVLRSSTQDSDTTAVTDTTDNKIQLGISTFMPDLFDSILVTVRPSISTLDTFFTIKKPDIKEDTVRYSCTFSTTGTRTVTVTGYVQGGFRPTASGTITILARPVPIVNHKPTLVITGRKTITTAEACTLFVSANHSDTTQALSYKVISGPPGYTFANQIFIWKPAASDTGSYSATFTVADNGVPVMADTQTVTISITKKLIPPYHVDSLQVFAKSNGTASFRWHGVSNADSFIVYRSNARDVNFLPRGATKDTTYKDQILTYDYYYYVKAVNAAGSSFSDTVYSADFKTINDTDRTGPTITQIIGPTSNSRTLTDSVLFAFEIKDTSGVDSVFCTINGVRSGLITHTGSIFTLKGKIPTFGLNTIQILARDSSTKKNESTLSIVLNYNTKPKPFSIISPIDGDTGLENTDGILCKWNPASDIDGDTAIYRLSYGQSLQNMTTIITREDSVNLENLRGGVSYLWTLVAIVGLDTLNCCSANMQMHFTTKNHSAKIVQALKDTSLTINDSIPMVIVAQDQDGIKEYWWDFNNDGTVDKITPIGTAIYKAPATPGVYKVKVLVADTTGKTTPSTATITVTNNFPTIKLTASDTVGFNKQIIINAVAKDDGVIKKYEWSIVKTGTTPDFQNRSKADTSFFAPDSNLPITLTAMLRVTDDDGNSTMDSVKIVSTMRWSLIADNVVFPGYGGGDDGCAAFFKDSIWYFAGDSIGATADGKTWVYTKLPQGIANRLYATLTTFNNKLWIINGDPGTSNGSNDIWSTSDGRNWVCDTNQSAFPLTFGATVTAFNNKLWLIGGFSSHAATNMVYSSADGKKWVAEARAGFPVRSSHATIVFDNKLWVIGGNGSTGVNNDIWSSSDGAAWEKKVISAGNAAIPSQYCSAVTFAGKMWLIGGTNTPGAWFSQDGTTWTRATSTGGPVSYTNAILVTDTKGGLWALGGLVPGFGTSPKVWYTSDVK